MSVMKEIQAKEKQIKLQIDQLHRLEEKLSNRVLPPKERELFEQEINLLKDKLLETEKALKHLHKENRRSFLLAIIIFFAFIVMYYFYNR